MNNLNAIGIIGGVGPAAGVDLFNRILSHTSAEKDQEHLNVLLTSCPSLIPDRTAYLIENGSDPVKDSRKRDITSFRFFSNYQAENILYPTRTGQFSQLLRLSLNKE